MDILIILHILLIYFIYIVTIDIFVFLDIYLSISMFIYLFIPQQSWKIRVIFHLTQGQFSVVLDFFFPWFPWWKIRIRPELVLIARGEKKNQNLCCFLWRNINIQPWIWRGNPERKNSIVFLSKGENKGDFILERRAKIQRFKAEAEFDRNSCLVQLIENFLC